jgi:two-component system chemotaxis sensor kinase CheA
MASARNNLLNIITSGKFSPERQSTTDMEELIRYVVLNISLVVGGSLLVAFGISLVFEGTATRGLLDLGIALFCFICIFLLRAKIKLFIIGILPISIVGVLFGLMIYSGDIQGFAGLWIFSFPLLSIFILGMKTGIILSLLLLIATAAIVFMPGFAGFAYSADISFRLCGVYALVLLLTIVYEQIRLTKDSWLNRLTQALQTERDEITAMKDNLKVGLFLMNKDLIIQPAYSKALEDVLIATELQGRNFLDLLAMSIKAKEIETLRDYFGMIFNRSFDQAMLDDINPLRELNYKSVETEAERILNCGFAPVSRGEGEIYILGTLQDITAEKELQRQLDQEEGKRQEEMRSLFEIVQVEPRIFYDFIEDSEYEFDRVNDILKDKSISSANAMVEIYQSVHAIKSNALILGLEGFGKKLHGLEDKIKNMRDKEDIPFEDVLHITVELEQIMREKDKFRETIDKILAFRGSGGGGQSGQVLIDTLLKASNKAANDLNKDVRFVPREVDGTALESGSRRVIKEVLTQLVRNSVVHGIESPEERIAAGKDPQGLIHLSVTIDDDKIHCRLKDDGRGLDFEKIKKRALEMKLISSADVDNKTQLIKALFTPGFSTADNVDVHAGRGVGLSLVQDRLREVKGSIKINTEPGRGTTFHIFIPLEANADAAISKAS